MAGAKGLNASLYFIDLLILSFMSLFLGSAKIDLFPSALSPNSKLP